MNQDSQTVIFYSAQTQFDNLGDLMINKILLSYLNQYGKVLVDDQGVPESYLQNLGVQPHQRISQFTLKPNYLIVWLRLKNLFHRQQNEQKLYYIASPGHRYGNDAWFQGFPLLKGILIRAIHRLCGIRLGQFGVSIGPFSKILMFHEVCSSKLMYFYSVRDSKSKDYARSIGIKNVNMFPDLAWLMEVDEQKYKNNQKGDYIIFSFRSSTHAFAPSENYHQQLFKRLDKIVEMARDKWSKKLVISYQVESDANFCQTIAQRYENLIDLTLIEHTLEESLMYELYSNASMVFSNRLHVLLFAMNCGALPVPVIDTLYHDKITGIFNDAGLEGLFIDVNSPTVEEREILEISENINFWKPKIAEVRQKQKALAEQLLKEVFT